MFHIPLPSINRPERYVVAMTICGACRAHVIDPTYWYVGMHRGLEVRDVYCDAHCSLIAHERRSLEVDE